jgi:adenosylcobinamide hydrolase
VTSSSCAPALVELGDPATSALCWRFDEPQRAISTAPVGGGLGERHWVVNAQVPIDYTRTDLDAHIGALAAQAGCHGEGVGFLTAAAVARYTTHSDGDVVAYATVGLDLPTWAAAPPEAESVPRVGTVNIVAFLPVALSDAAMVNAVATATEAKAQALFELGVPGTGTATDAIGVLAPVAKREPEPFGGPRSPIGAALARAVHRAVADGTRQWHTRRGRS